MSISPVIDGESRILNCDLSSGEPCRTIWLQILSSVAKVRVGYGPFSRNHYSQNGLAWRLPRRFIQQNKPWKGSRVETIESQLPGDKTQFRQNSLKDVKMRRSQFHSAVARATGEDHGVILQRGFSLVDDTPAIENDDIDALITDWERVEAEEVICHYHDESNPLRASLPAPRFIKGRSRRSATVLRSSRTGRHRAHQ